MEAKTKLKFALVLVRPDLREAFLEDLALRLAGSLAGLPSLVNEEFEECIAQALESVDVPRSQGVR